MLVDHLFRFPEKLNGVSYITIIPGLEPTIEYILGDFGGICVSMYLFLSGYGLYRSAIKKRIFTFGDLLKKIFLFLINYWVIFCIFVPIGLIFFNGNGIYSWDLINILKNFFAISSTFNGAWWFVSLYIELLIVFPLFKMVLEKNIKLFVFMITSLFLFSFSINLFSNHILIFQYLKNSEPIVFFRWQFSFSIGCIFSKYNLFEKLYYYLNRIKLNKKIFYIFIIIVTIIFRCGTNIVFGKYGKGAGNWIEFSYTPFFIFASTSLLCSLKSNKFFKVLGKHSTNMWLIHTFFCWYYFQKIVFIPKFSILIVSWLILLSLTSSVLVNFIIVRLQASVLGSGYCMLIGDKSH